MPQPAARFVIVTPVLDDWGALQLLLGRLDAALAERGLGADVLVVDDGSTQGPPAWGGQDGARGVRRVRVLRLRRNLGHQRAIAVALTHLEQTEAYDAVIVMDCDGEDRADHVPLLLDAHRRSAAPRIVFAQRARRSEGWSFRCFYCAYRAAFRALTGRPLRMGNFSLIPGALLPRVVGCAELWNHYSAAILKSRIPFTAVPLDRGARLAGRSKMNFVSLILHGLSAVSVFADVVGVRLLLAAVGMSGVSLALAAAAAAVRLATDLAVPGWATTAVGLCLLATLQSLTLAFVLVLTILHNRSNVGFVPLRDYRFFIADAEPRRQPESPSDTARAA